MYKLTSTQGIASANPSISNFLIGLSHVVCLRLFLPGKKHDGKTETVVEWWLAGRRLQVGWGWGTC
jgi:hypothetical protein